jgi:hypothetical protein
LLFFAFCATAITKYAEAATQAGYNTPKPMFTNLENMTLWQEELITAVCLTVWHSTHCTFNVTTPCGLKTVLVFSGMETTI